MQLKFVVVQAHGCRTFVALIGLVCRLTGWAIAVGF